MAESSAVFDTSAGGVDDGLRSTHILATLGFGCLLGWELSMVFAPAFPLLAFCDLRQAIFLRVASVLALALAYALSAWKADWVFVHRNRLFTLGSLLALVTVANTCANLLFGGLPFGTSVLAWVLIGVAQASIALYWCVFFSLVPARRTPLTVSLGSVVGTTLFVIVNSSGVVWVNLMGIILLIVGSVGLVDYLSLHIPRDSVLPVKEYRRTPTLSWKAALSVACHGVVYGFMSIELCSMGFEAALVGGASGMVGTLLALLWSVLGPRVDIDTGVVQRISLPPLVASVLLFPFFDGPGRIACACLANIALAHTTLFSWYSTSVENHEFRLHPVDRFALRQVPSQVGFFFGSMLAYVLIFVLQTTGVAFSLVMVVLAIVVVAAFSVYGGDESKTKAQLDEMLALAAGTAAGLVRSQEDDEAVDDRRPGRFKQNCEVVAERYVLTPREAEVFPLLAKGRNAAYIAENLGVSPATVKSHIYHIYQKLGVNSQQNLIDIVDGCDDRES